MANPKVTQADIEARIIGTEYIVRGTLTICILNLTNSYKLVGTSACVFPENYDAQLGYDLAYKDAIGQAWKLEGYLLAERRYLETVKPTE